jgi:hypothetical protein
LESTSTLLLLILIAIWTLFGFFLLEEFKKGVSDERVSTDQITFHQISTNQQLLKASPLISELFIAFLI